MVFCQDQLDFLCPVITGQSVLVYNVLATKFILPIDVVLWLNVPFYFFFHIGVHSMRLRIRIKSLHRLGLQDLEIWHCNDLYFLHCRRENTLDVLPSDPTSAEGDEYNYIAHAHISLSTSLRFPSRRFWSRSSVENIIFKSQCFARAFEPLLLTLLVWQWWKLKESMTLWQYMIWQLDQCWFLRLDFVNKLYHRISEGKMTDFCLIR